MSKAATLSDLQTTVFPEFSVPSKRRMIPPSFLPGGQKAGLHLVDKSRTVPFRTDKRHCDPTSESQCQFPKGPKVAESVFHAKENLPEAILFRPYSPPTD